MATNRSIRQLMDDAGANQVAQRDKVSDDEKLKLAILETLGRLGGLTVADDDLIFNGSKIVLPESYNGRVPEAIEYLERYVQGQEKHYAFTKAFRYRPLDGANAFQNTMLKHFGTGGLGKTTVTFFGDYPPQYRTIDVGHGKQSQVPWGEVQFPPLEAVFTLGATRDAEYGILFNLSVDAPKKYRKHIDAFFQLVEQELKNNSIYKGKAITGAQDPQFLDVSRVDRSKVVFSDEVMTQLDANLWSLLNHTDTMRELRMPLKRAVLLEGPYGTGKTLAGMLTAQTAEHNGWTYILCRPGQDDLAEVLKTAQIYQPSVIWFEDIDTVSRGGSEEEISKLLDILDGITSKGAEVVAGFTTNFIEKIQKGVLRPGRIDAVIHVGELDQSGFERLIKVLVAPKLLGDVDYAQVAKAFTGFLPAFAAEAINRAMRYSIARNEGTPDMVTTDDLVNAALGLRPQLDLMNGASEGANVPTIDGLLTSKVGDVLSHTKMVDDDGDEQGWFLKHNPEQNLSWNKK